MFRSFLMALSITGCLIVALFLCLSHSPTAQAEHLQFTDLTTPTPATTPTVATTPNAALALTTPGNTTMTGQPGAAIQLVGSNFLPNTQINLYVTADQGQCTVASMGSLQAFQQATATTDGTGAFTVTSTWPSSAATPTTAYYVCAIATANGTAVVSDKPFTISQSASASLSTNSANPGDLITVNGANWPAYQQVTISIGMANVAPVVTQNATTDANGNFSATVTIPTTAQAGAYNLSVAAANNPTSQFTQNGALVVNAAASTPTTQPSPTAAVTPTPVIQATPTPTTGAGSGGSSSLTPWIFSLGGLGVILVIIGLTMFISYSNKS